MAKLDTNLDACQLSSEILIRLRKVVRETLRGTFGKTWEENGIPAEIRDYLTQRQAREASINWNLSDTVDVLDFAGYVNLYDIISANPNLLQRFLPLAPDAHVLRIRFLELDTILSRIAYARPISEADLGFLVSFEDRVKKTSGAAPPAPPAQAAEAPSPTPARRATDNQPSPPPTRRATDGLPSPGQPLGVAAPQAAAKPDAAAGHGAVAGRRAARAAPSAPQPEPEAVETAPLAAPEPAPAAPEPQPEPQPAVPQPVVAAPLVGLQEVAVALKKGDNKTVLTALYQEVTALADGLWNGSVASLQARTWENVRESQWYHDRFAKLGLKSISDFFGLFDAAKEKMLNGTSRAELQEFLKEHNFVQVLLALKDLFRQHMKP